jgi:hypothetical protein
MVSPDADLIEGAFCALLTVPCSARALATIVLARMDLLFFIV